MTEKGKMSRQEAGRKGGEATLNKHGSKYYQELGRKGGKASARMRADKRCLGDYAHRVLCRGYDQS